MTLTQDIKSKLSQLNVLEKISVVNVLVFLLGLLLQLPLEAIKESSLLWFELPSEFSDFIFLVGIKSVGRLIENH